ncbi:hypothetical protein EVAR_47643_1 [Eumeta japonica]|uniref:Uncharacterized protein n=1 Tax=Eumeta variegata TaxID=151549 RepID=A0A4C1ZF23_EUMVA|nr:hypothetical protein EVAR_47643_1 [Eumeta japonica]
MEGGRRHLVSARSTSKAGGPRSVRVCRSLKGQRPGSLQITLVDTVSCGVWRPAAPRTLDRQGREGREAAICTKSE